MKHLHISFALILICTFGLTISTSQPVKGKSLPKKCVLPVDGGDFSEFLNCVENEQGLRKDFMLVKEKVKGVDFQNSKSKRFFYQIENSLKAIQIFFERLIEAILKPGPNGPDLVTPDTNGEGGESVGEGGEDRKMKKKKKNEHN